MPTLGASDPGEAMGQDPVSAASQSHAEKISKFRFSTGCILDW